MNVNNFQNIDFSRLLNSQKENEGFVRDTLNNGLNNVGKNLDTWAKDKRQWNQMLENQAYQRKRDAIADKRYEQQMAYQRERDAIADARYAQQMAVENERRQREELQRQARIDAMRRSQEMIRKNFLVEQPQSPYQTVDSGEGIQVPDMMYSDANGFPENVKFMNDYGNAYGASTSYENEHDPYEKIRKYGEPGMMYLDAMLNTSNPDDFDVYRTAFGNMVSAQRANERIAREQQQSNIENDSYMIQQAELEGLRFGMNKNPEWQAKMALMKDRFYNKYGVAYDTGSNVGLQTGIDQQNANNAAYQVKYNQDLDDAKLKAERFKGTSMYGYTIEREMHNKGYNKYRYR